MKIVEYNDSYAAKVAEMWNVSASSWGNEEAIKTAADVIASEASSGNEKLYLAIDNDQVVGYCSFSEYKQDEGASYLPLLNVIPGYHGKKVGKALILRVLEDAIVSKWQRFDLYTWSGNIKAMPLYKKCGFFWERKNNSVHLMNFIPYLFQTEALNEYMSKIDWYKDSIRKIDMEQDGELRNGFDIYRYDFENDKTKLAMEFERSSRGLRLLETPDYLIEVSVDEHELVFGENYEVSYYIVNKNPEKPLEVKLVGKNNKNIEHSLDLSLDVKDTELIKAEFFVGPIKKDQNKGKTYPSVETDIYINGKHANFRLGVEPKFPVKLKLKTAEYNHVFNKLYDCYLDVENNLSTTENFKIALPNSFVNFNGDLEVELKAKEKGSFKLNYSVNSYGIYDEEAIITYRGKSVRKNIHSVFKGANNSFTGIMDSNAVIVSGNYVMSYNFERNVMELENGHHMDAKTAFFVPQIGRPHSLEFNNIPAEIEFVGKNGLVATLKSVAFEDTILKIHLRNEYGLVTVFYELINHGPQREYSLSIPVWRTLEDNVIPFDGKLLDIKGMYGGSVSNIDHTKVDENWFYNKKDKCGFCWDKSEDMKVSDWKMIFDKDNISLNTNESYRSGEFNISFVHPNVQEFRAFAGNNNDKTISNYLDLVVNGGNPFTSNSVGIEIKNNRKIDLAGTFTVDHVEKGIDSTLEVNPGLKVINVSLKDKNYKYERLIHKTSGNIVLSEDDGILTVDNGNVSFKASANYADAIYSLKFDGHEWLDSTFPTPTERVWWGDFVGGINLRANDIPSTSALKENITTEFVKLEDNYGNTWEGIKTRLSINIDPELKGLMIDSYCVTLPGVKMIHSFTNILNNTGKAILGKQLHRFNTLLVDDDPKMVRVKQDNSIYKCADVGIEVDFDKLAVFESTRNYKMGIYNKKNRMLLETQEGFTILFSEGRVDVPDRGSKQYAGDFIIFTKDNLTKDMLIDLDNIVFTL